MVRHDRSYRKLFAHPRMAASLLGDLLGEGLTGPLDFATLERVPDSFLGPRHAARQADLIWRLRRPDGRPLYVLLEFQSEVQRSCPCGRSPTSSCSSRSWSIAASWWTAGSRKRWRW